MPYTEYINIQFRPLSLFIDFSMKDADKCSKIHNKDVNFSKKLFIHFIKAVSFVQEDKFVDSFLWIYSLEYMSIIAWDIQALKGDFR